MKQAKDRAEREFQTMYIYCIFPPGGSENWENNTLWYVRSKAEGQPKGSKYVTEYKPMPAFDDDFKGERWTYGLNYRPLLGGGAPEGYILHSDRKHPDHPTFGTIDYPRKLAENEIENFQLKEIK